MMKIQDYTEDVTLARSCARFVVRDIDMDGGQTGGKCYTVFNKGDRCKISEEGPDKGRHQS